jgi:biopolymer transport protein ExbB/TolQ
MEFLNKIQQYLNTLEQKKFFQYMIGLIAGIILIIALLLFLYFRSVYRLKAEISRINEEREETRAILDKAAQVKKDQKQFDAILAQDENFKIAHFSCSRR